MIAGEIDQVNQLVYIQHEQSLDRYDRLLKWSQNLEQIIVEAAN